MPEIKRKPSESFESLLRRFRYQIMRSGRLIQAKKVRFRVKKKSKTLERESALRREKIKALRDELIKQGKLKEGDKIKLHKLGR
jgi:ribosomal protein S21